MCKRRIGSVAFAFVICVAMHAQVLTLDSCRSLAVQNNKALLIGKVKRDAAQNVVNAARTKYLPHVSVMAGYEWTSREMSILNDEQKNTLNNLGSNVSGRISGIVQGLVEQKIISKEMMGQIGPILTEGLGVVSAVGNHFGSTITDAFRTDNRNVWAGSVMVTQPLYMGGAITAANRIADIQKNMADVTLEHLSTETLYDVDQNYWLVVSLRQKQKLAESFCKLVGKLDSDVQKMIAEGIATRADGLKVSVKKNESDMTLSRVNDGLALAKMALCQRCGLPVDSEIQLADENTDAISMVEDNTQNVNVEDAIDSRAEVRMLQNAVGLTEQATKLVRAAYLPQAGLTGGYLISNPNLYNGFEKKFGGVFNLGVIVRIPVWNWNEGVYKVRAAKAATVMAEYQLSEAKEMIELQISQQRYQVNEAKKRLVVADNNIKSAEENLRCAEVGFKEGVMGSTEVIAAQTAWLEAQTQKIDAEISLRMSMLSLKKAMGVM